MKKALLCIILALGCISFIQAQEFKRNIEKKTFVPKGQWILGSSVSYSEHNEKNYQFLIVEGFDSDGYTFKVSPMIGYAFFDNMTLGARFAYGRTLFKLDDVDLTIDEETSVSLTGLYQLKHSYEGMIVMRNYINLGSSKRFALFNEMQLKIGGGTSKVINRNGPAPEGTYSKTTDIGFGISPGIVAFVNNYMAVEVNVGVLGLDFKKVKQIQNQVHTTERSSSSANFNINLFSIGLGMAFYL